MSHAHVVTLYFGTPASNVSSAPTPDSDEDTENHAHQAVWNKGELAPMVPGSDDVLLGHFHILIAGESRSGPDDIRPAGPANQYPEGAED